VKYRKLGKTDCEVSILSYGASALGSVFRNIDEQEGMAAVHAAFDVGINYFDTSPFYGITESERILGNALKEHARDSYILSTKSGRFGWDAFDFSTKRILRSVEESLQRLHVEYLDIVNLHDIEYKGGEFTEQALFEGLSALQQLKKEGKIRYYGIATYPLDLIRRVVESIPLDTVMNHKLYTLSDTRLLGLLPLLKEKEIGLIHSAPLGSGFLSSRGVASWHPATEGDKAVVQKAAACCKAQGSSIEKLAIQFATSHPDIPTCLVSSASKERIRSNAACLGEPMDEALIKEVRTILQPVSDRDWDDFSEKELK